MGSQASKGFSLITDLLDLEPVVESAQNLASNTVLRY
jgi:hypothetical protein